MVSGREEGMVSEREQEMVSGREEMMSGRGDGEWERRQ